MKNARKSRTLSRRNVLKTFAAGTAAAAIPTIVPAGALGLAGATAPSNRVAMGFIGTGGRMGALMGAFLPQKDVQAIAVADPRDGPRNAAAKRTKVDPKASYRDFRELLQRSDIDAVAIASPDYWHVLHSITAIKAGKDVYCEKPLSNTIAEGRALVETVKRYGAIFSTVRSYTRWRPYGRRANSSATGRSANSRR